MSCFPQATRDAMQMRKRPKMKVTSDGHVTKTDGWHCMYAVFWSAAGGDSRDSQYEKNKMTANSSLRLHLRRLPWLVWSVLVWIFAPIYHPPTLLPARGTGRERPLRSLALLTPLLQQHHRTCGRTYMNSTYRPFVCLSLLLLPSFTPPTPPPPLRECTHPFAVLVHPSLPDADRQTYAATASHNPWHRLSRRTTYSSASAAPAPAAPAAAAPRCSR
ncbi:hypothetical protein IWX90DRAFT_322791 [Phyllosticta citrichinensis]|uniref:Uncharacterized protein n=1 Tax=Phyllosticta citrichinensis TaxID=1130410 RepID=A0ABR1XK66_9PEZI